MKNFVLLIFLLATTAIYTKAQCPSHSRAGVHVVQRGENLYRIAKFYNVSLLELASWNNIRTDATLYICQELKTTAPSSLPTTYSRDILVERTGTPTVVNRALVRQKGNKHIIQPGETIDELARLYGYTAERFRAINLLDSREELSVGSIILSSDCACGERVTSYDWFNNGYAQQPVSSSSAPSIYSNNASVNTGVANVEQSRGRDYDYFYDRPQGNYLSNSGSAVVGQIRSLNPTTPNSTPNQKPSSTNSSYASSNKAKATYMSSEELSMLDEINMMRSNPSGYIPYIEQYKQDILSGKSFGSSIAVCDELIEELRRTPPLSILQPISCLYSAAKKHGLDQKSRGSTGHDGSDGSWPWDRVRRECPQLSDGNENLVGGPSSVREAVILLLVDDGIPSRGHRNTLLNKDWKYGVTYKIGKVGYMPNCWVQKFAY